MRALLGPGHRPETPPRPFRRAGDGCRDAAVLQCFRFVVALVLLLRVEERVYRFVWPDMWLYGTGYHLPTVTLVQPSRPKYMDMNKESSDTM